MPELAIETARVLGEVARRLSRLPHLLIPVGVVLMAALALAVPLTVAAVSTAKVLYSLIWLYFRFAPPALIGGVT
jgi:hypothetical protein